MFCVCVCVHHFIYSSKHASVFRNEETGTERTHPGGKSWRWSFDSGCLTSKAFILSKGADEGTGTQMPLLGGWGRGRMGMRISYCSFGGTPVTFYIHSLILCLTLTVR